MLNGLVIILVYRKYIYLGGVQMEDIIRRTIPRRNITSPRKRSRAISHFYGVRKLLIQLMISAGILVCILGIRNFNASLSNEINNVLNASVDFNGFYSKANDFAKYIYKESKFFFNREIKTETQSTQPEKVQPKDVTLKGTNITSTNNTENTAAEPAKDTPKVNIGTAETSSNTKDKPKYKSAVLSSVSSLDLDAKALKSEYLFLRPVKGEITSSFGLRINPITKKGEFHPGLDMRATVGAPIQAALGGKVIESRAGTTFGNFIRIQSGEDNIITVYAHCSKLLAKKGQTVKRGQKIALAGSTGLSNGPHLHFEIWKDGRVVDPTLVFSK